MADMGKNKDKLRHGYCHQGLHSETILGSTFLSISLNTQGINRKLIVTFALCTLRGLDSIQYFYFCISFEIHCNHYFSVLTVTKYGHLPK